MSRRSWLGVAVAGVATAAIGGVWWMQSASPEAPAAPQGQPLAMTVYSSPSCGCCHRWVEHLERNGFVVTVESAPDVTPHKKRLGIPERLWSCHTGLVEGYAVEGHVPADLVRRLVTERAAVAGIAVPGMPNGSPGMEGGAKDAYDVLTFDRAGATQVYAVR